MVRNLTPTHTPPLGPRDMRERRAQQRHLSQLKTSNGPRYVVYYWIYRPGKSGVAFWYGHDTDRYDRAVASATVAATQPCCNGSKKNVFIYDRVYKRSINWH